MSEKKGENNELQNKITMSLLCEYYGKLLTRKTI